MSAVPVVDAAPVEPDWRLTEFVMRTWTDPELAARYRRDPVGTLAEHGIRLRSPEEAPMPAGDAGQLVIEDLSRPEPDAAPWPCCVE